MDTQHSPRTTLETLLPSCAIVHGWHLAGPGPARYGWAARSPGGEIRYLGRGDSATDAARNLGKLYGSH